MMIVVGLLIFGACMVLAWRRPYAMLVLAPVLGGVCVVYALGRGSDEAWWFGVVLFAVIVGVAVLRLMTMNPSRGRTVALWLIGLMLFVGVCAGFVAVGSIYGLMIDLLLFFALMRFLRIGRQVRTATIVSTIGTSMRQNLPLPAALREAAGEERDATSETLREIAEGLEEGLPLGDALEGAYPRCPGHVLGMVRMAERVDQLPRALAVLDQDLIAETRRASRVQPVNAWYPVAVLCIELAIVTGLMYFVVPKFMKIFSDYGLELPRSTAIVIGAFRGTYGGFWLIPVLILVWLALRLHMWLQPRRPRRPWLRSRVGDWLRWRIPVFRWFEENSSQGRLVESLRLSLGAGATMVEAIDQALELDLNGQYRKRVLCWREAVGRGEDAGASARSCRLGRSLGWAFDSRVNAGNVLSVLEMLARVYRSNYSYRANLARYVLAPFTVVGLGFAVGFVVYAFFVPLTAMIYGTMELAMP